ncbi:MAG: cell wall-binding repeat-containing protein [Candidatus Contubernalis sp.]|nr:cell wall-binding repeat-containing protein [Candidatus Contubernalis sp.]
MEKRVSVKILFTLVIMFMVMSLFIGTVSAESQHEISRIYGTDRYETSARVSSGIYESSDTVIIARGDAEGNYADAVAASLLAGVLDCPILLTRPTSLPASIADEIVRLGATETYVLGGPNAVSGTVVDSIEALGIDVERIAGNNRYETAAAVALFARDLGEIADYAFIVNGFATADALVSGGYAFNNNVPILLVSRDIVPDITRATLTALGIEDFYIVGGTGVVGNDVENYLKT